MNSNIEEMINKRSAILKISISDHLVGLKIAKVVGFRGNKKEKEFDVHYILFDNKTTIMEFEEQNYYDYHDCSSSARLIQLRFDSDFWKRINEDEENYPVANMTLLYSFIS
jgi:hypothetical protein